MLVMYTLNQSVSSKLPRTAYIKFIDVWLIFGLCLPFMIMILLVVIEHYPEDNVSAFKISASGSERIEKKKILSRKDIEMFTKVILPILESLFIVVYILIAIMIY